MKAFNEACQFPTKSTVMIPKGEYKLGEIVMMGPCKAPIRIALLGTVKADGNANGKEKWVAFRNINGFKLNGGGVFDGEGNAAWRVNNCHKTFNCKKLPIVRNPLIVYKITPRLTVFVDVLVAFLNRALGLISSPTRKLEALPP